MIDLPKIKEDFSLLVKEAQPWTLTQFVMWLDLKLSEFKIKGYMVLDHNIKTKPKWLVEEAGSGEITPSPAPCPQCSKPSRDERQFYSDIHATPSELQNRNVTKNVSQDDDNIRGEVGVIDLSEGVVQKQNVNRTQAGTHRSPHIQSYRQISHQDFNKGDSAKRQRTDVIEIDPPVSKEKRFVPRPFHKTSTPMARSRFQQLQQRPRPQRPVLSTGSTIYTSTISQTTPSFSTGYSGQTQRMPAASRSFALGAPPVVTSTMTTSFTEYENLENLITQAIQNTEPINIGSQPTVSTPAGDRSTMLAGYSQSQSSISPTKTSFSSTNVEGQRNTSQTSSEIQISPQTSFDNVIPATDNTQGTFGSQQQNQYSTPVTTQAVPVALHAIGDVINRDNSSSSLPGSSDYEITEIKIESDPEDSMNESSITDTSVGNISQPLDTSQSLPQMQGSSFSLDASGLPKPGLVDPDTAKTYQKRYWVTCDICRKIFESTFKLKRHKTRTHGPKVKCTYCDWTCQTHHKERLRVHVNRHHRNLLLNEDKTMATVSNSNVRVPVHVIPVTSMKSISKSNVQIQENVIPGMSMKSASYSNVQIQENVIPGMSMKSVSYSNVQVPGHEFPVTSGSNLEGPVEVIPVSSIKTEKP